MDWADAVEALRFKGTPTSAVIEAFTTKVVDKALVKLERLCVYRGLTEEDGMAVMGMVDRPEDYGLFKKR